MSLLSPRLVAFLAVAKYKTVHSAANKINLTQTAVTQRIKALEQSLKTTLFIRTRKGMKVTPEGEVLLRYCQTITSLEGEVLAKLQGHVVELEVELSITSESSMMRSRVIPSLTPILKKYRNLLFSFRLADEEKRHVYLKSGQCDFAIIDEHHLTAEMSYKKLQPEEYVMVCSSTWRKRSLEDILTKERIVDFNSQDQMTFRYLERYGLSHMNRHQRYYVNSTVNIAQLIGSAMGYSVLAKEFAEPYVQAGDLYILNHGQTLNIQPYLAWYDRPQPPRYFQEIIDAIC